MSAKLHMFRDERESAYILGEQDPILWIEHFETRPNTVDYTPDVLVEI